ncbi:DUF1109 domain-containing protein [Ciceribacter sp. L1K23]|uniref:NrsF family protein n=1 Tax=Ciceribacter sp. L1K23 TaxID=2820276 RepID=UPI001B810EF5|nr:DUF1109 domain-containing protein [Ciceribacter sp. L1K23]MBR0556543.1 DUF1109 domain-containing protein [Ciceribacter sp. L1K23]
MKTDELIRLLSEDAPVRMRYRRALAAAIVFGAVAAVSLLLSTYGLRPDLADQIETLRVAFKIGASLLAAVLACRLVLRIGRPGLSVRGAALSLLVPLGLLVLAVAAELVVLPQADWMPKLLGRNATFCLVLVPTLSFLPLVALLWAMRNGAPDNPGLAGAAAGIAAGAIGATVYALHCPDDSPLFVATWYPLAIAIVTIAGYGAGRRALRW